MGWKDPLHRGSISLKRSCCFRESLPLLPHWRSRNLKTCWRMGMRLRDSGSACRVSSMKGNIISASCNMNIISRGLSLSSTHTSTRRGNMFQVAVFIGNGTSSSSMRRFFVPHRATSVLLNRTLSFIANHFTPSRLDLFREQNRGLIGRKRNITDRSMLREALLLRPHALR